MLPKSKRLTRDDFSKLQKRTTIRGNYFDVVISPSSETKFACVITKKRIKLATNRNSVRRKIYHALNGVVIKSPHLVIFYPKQNAHNASYKALLEEIQKVFATI
ncbi:MAG: ribonuclease P protein component [Candidatus Paceibacterota bacterium]|jgi:ribonuclease P protein component